MIGMIRLRTSPENISKPKRRKIVVIGDKNEDMRDKKLTRITHQLLEGLLCRFISDSMAAAAVDTFNESTTPTD